VSASYLKACGATVYFIETPQSRVPDGLEMHENKYHYAENEADMPEGLQLEDM
jgi:hypothetical protein